MTSSDAQPPTSLRTARAQRTRDAIAAAALRLAAEHGYEATTVEEVAAEAGVCRRTVFNYFPTKVDMFLRAPQAPDQAAIEAFAASEGDLLTDLAELVARANSTGPQADEFRTLRRILHDNPCLHPELVSRVRLFHSVIRAALAQRLDADLRSHQVVVATALASTLLRTAVELWSGETQIEGIPGQSPPPPETIPEAIDVVMAAMHELLTSATATSKK